MVLISSQQNFVPKLKQHILPRIKAVLADERATHGTTHIPSQGSSTAEDPDTDNQNDTTGVFFKNDCMYYHQTIKIHYTTYDVRRSQDILNPRTLHRDIMGLARPEGESGPESMHPFWYARILKIFHVNVVYTGVGMIDYHPRRLDVLWVRWFQLTESPPGLGTRRLDPVSFLAQASEAAFGFLDPSDVLRGCQIIPAFKKGRVHEDGRGLSRYAGDANDWRGYLVNK